MKIVFMGTPDFASKSLEALVESGYEVALAVTQPDAKKDRGKKVKFPPVKEAAIAAGIDVMQPEKVRDEDFMETMKSINPDLIVVAAYGQILPKELLELPKFGCVNVHASLLPKFRGSAPIQHAILSGDEKTGVTIMQMAEGLDTGDMLTKAEVDIDHKNCEELHDELATVGAKLLVDTIPLIESGRVTPEKQDDSLATLAPMLSKKDGLVDFSLSAEEIERKIRAFYPWPGTFTYLDGEMFKIWQARALDEDGGKEPGSVLGADKEGIKVCCGKGALLLETVQAPGKKRMSAEDYLKGNKIEISTILG